MTKEQIDALFDRIRTWTPERQEEAAAFLLALEAEADDDAYEPSPAERAELETALAEVGRGEVATVTEVAAAFRRRA